MSSVVLLAQHLEASNLQDFWAATNSCKDTIKQGELQESSELNQELEVGRRGGGKEVGVGQGICPLLAAPALSVGFN